MSEDDSFARLTPLGSLPRPPCAAHLGWKLLDVDPERGWVKVQFESRPEFANPAGFVQGGFLAAMLDDCMGPALVARTKGESFPTTLDMNVSYLAAAKLGTIIGEGQVLQLGKTIAFLEGRLSDESGQLLARATSTARLVPASRLAK